MTDQVAWTVERQGEKGDVANADVGTAPGCDVRLTWEDVLTREEVLIGLAVIEQAIIETDWPPVP